MYVRVCVTAQRQHHRLTSDAVGVTKVTADSSSPHMPIAVPTVAGCPGVRVCITIT